MFEVKRLEKTYGDTAALAGVSHAFAPGKITALLGPSGCGKSTLLRCLLNLIRPTAGEVLFDGKPVTAAAEQGVRRRTGYMLQSGGLFPHLTAGKNVTLLAGRLGQIDRGRVGELRELAQLPAEALDRYPAELSGGQRQRVALMRALMLDPEALLLDEPLGALDPMTRAELQRDLRQIFRDLGKTVVLVTHDLAEASYFADEIVLMQGGQVVQVGPPADLRDRPADDFVARFVNAQQLVHGEVA